MNGPVTVAANFTSSSGPDLNTYYTYDLMNHVRQVVMPRSTGTQTRTFNYNNTGFLQSATNPENGTVTYTYASNGMVASKSDAKGQRIVYVYDGNFLIRVEHYPAPGNVEDLCQRITYYYSADPFPGYFSQYAYGRRPGAEYNRCSTELPAQFQERYSYTAGGLVTRKRLTVTENVAPPGNTNLKSVDLDTAQTYDNEGKVLTVKYPDTKGFDIDNQYVTLPGATYTYTYDGMGRPITLADDRTTPVNWVNNCSMGRPGS